MNMSVSKFRATNNGGWKNSRRGQCFRFAFTLSLLFCVSAIATCPSLSRGQTVEEPTSATNATIASQINDANGLVRDGKVTEAIDAYSEIPTSEAYEEQLNYNLGIAHYRNGDFDAAMTLFTKVAGSTKKQLASDSQYNLGNCHYSSALAMVTPSNQDAANQGQMAKPDLAAAIKHLEDAIGFFRGAIRSDPENSDARANIELAVELLKQLNQQQEEQEEQEQQQQDKKQDEQNDQENKDDQKQDEQKKGDEKQDQDKQENKENQNQQNQDQNQDSEKSDSDEQESPGEESKQEQGQREDQQDSGQRKDNQTQENQTQNSQNQQPDDKSDESSDEKQSEEQSEEESKEGKDKKPTPTGELSSADQQDEKARDEKGKAFREMADGKDQMMSYEEALKVLQSVRDRDMLRRLKQERLQRLRRMPVDKDW